MSKNKVKILAKGFHFFYGETAAISNVNIEMYEKTPGEFPMAIKMWTNDAQVLNKTCPA